MMNSGLSLIVCGLVAVGSWLVSLPELVAQEAVSFSGVVQQEFLFEEAPFPSCHASTICETKAGLVAAWFGGSREGAVDVGIWLSRQVEGKWTAPALVADGIPDEGPRLPCWNPVLFQIPEGDLLLFYKVGPSPSSWWGMVKRSRDGGVSWGEAERLPDGYLGPVRNKPLWIEGRMLCGSSTEDDLWRVHFERIDPEFKEWVFIGLRRQEGNFNVIQPTLLQHADGRIQALCRSQEGSIIETWSADRGETWSQLTPTSLPNPNAGIDGVTLRDGRHLLVYNHTQKEEGTPRGRELLNLAVSKDGRDWQPAGVFERGAGEYSYPAVIQSADGMVHVTYTYERKRIKHVVIDPGKMEGTTDRR